jgi:hypothetical protein
MTRADAMPRPASVRGAWTAATGLPAAIINSRSLAPKVGKLAARMGLHRVAVEALIAGARRPATSPTGPRRTASR